LPSAINRAELITKQADIVAALTLEVLKGTTHAFDSGTAANFSLKKKTIN
jgi:histidine ammonia-lyase